MKSSTETVAPPKGAPSGVVTNPSKVEARNRSPHTARANSTHAASQVVVQQVGSTVHTDSQHAPSTQYGVS